MLDKTSLYTRLFLCLLLSAGIHGGLVYLGWLETPVHLAVQNPVEVAFLPVVDIAPPIAEKEAEEIPEPVARQEPKPNPKVPPKSVPRPLAEKKKEVAPVKPVEAPVTVEAAREIIDEIVAEPDAEVTTETAVDSPVPVVPQAQEKETAGAVAAPVIVEAVPRYSGNPLPVYPYLARQRHWEGVVWLLVDVTADGSVDDLRVEQSSGYKILDRSAKRTVARWRFEPATRAGIPVTSQVRIPVRFRLERP